MDCIVPVDQTEDFSLLPWACSQLLTHHLCAAGFRMDHKTEGQKHRVRTWAFIVKVNEYDH